MQFIWSVIFGIKKENQEEEEITNLKSNFINIFNNQTEVVKAYNKDVIKTNKDKDIIFTSTELNKESDEYNVNLKLPLINIESEVAKKYNEEIEKTFLDKANSILSTKNSQDLVIYNVKYKAYLYEDILSLAIMSELKEGENSQRIIIQTYNYNLKENKEISIDEFIKMKQLEEKDVNEKIKEEVDKSQEQNIRLKEAGYNVNVRDSSSSAYKVENAKTYFIGKNGYLYIIYPYGNEEFTSQMDIIIFK